MKRNSFCLAILSTSSSSVHGERCSSVHTPQDSRCTGCPPMYKGKLCASTTRYNDQTKAACGCGAQDPVPPDWWTVTELTAAINCKNLDASNPMLAWCPNSCGACYELCTTGGTTQGNVTAPDVCQVFKVTNRCGDGYREYPMWCSNELSWQDCLKYPERCQQQNSTNWYGYPAHFDLQDLHLQVSTGLKWNNVEVTFEPVSCSKWKGPAWDCQCDAGNSNVSAGSRAEFTFDATADTISSDSVASLSQTTQTAESGAAALLVSLASAEAIAAASGNNKSLLVSPLLVSSLDEDAGFCCTAPTNAADVCGSCDTNSIAKTASFCGHSREQCAQCGAQSKWCPMTSQVQPQTYLRLKAANVPIHWKDSQLPARGAWAVCLLGGGMLLSVLTLTVAVLTKLPRSRNPDCSADAAEAELLAPGTATDM